EYETYKKVSSAENKRVTSMQKQEKEKIKPTSVDQGFEPDIKKYIQNETIEPFSEGNSKMPAKKEIVEKLINLGSNSDSQVRERSIETLLAPYSRESGKVQDIWNELLKMVEDKDTAVRKNAAEMLSYIFPMLEEKSKVFFDLIRLTESQDSQVRKKAAELLNNAFLYFDDKQRAWNELVRLESSADREVRKGAVLSLSSGYSEVPDKDRAWKDLFKLSAHTDTFVQRAATRALGSAFFHVPDKTQAWRDLQMLTENPYIYVRRYAFRSLGRASLWRALKAENEATYIFGLKEAVKYFKEAAETPVDANIPEYYQPFYEALLFILFSDRKGIARTESEKYLSKMRTISGITDQHEGKQLPEIFEKLAELLRSGGDLNPGDLQAQKKLLETSVLIFDEFSNIIENKEEAIISRKTLKKEHPNPGKAILDRVEKKKSFLMRKP
ncbi:MAG TPA: hypothetical protein VN278_07160, partial [Methanosarcina sp.]|nr:hypothetical protein [Methanosarcina sp.]